MVFKLLRTVELGELKGHIASSRWLVEQEQNEWKFQDCFALWELGIKNKGRNVEVRSD